MSRKLMRMRSVIGFAGLAVVVVATASCGDVIRSSRSPALLVVTSLQDSDGSGVLVSDPIVNGTVFNDIATATLSLTMKNFTAPTSTNNRVTINRYHVLYRRADGRNAPGVDVPFPFDGAVTSSIDANGSGSVSFEIVRHVAKKESPLVQLINEVRVINAIADVTFYGQDLVGNDVSATGSIQIDFANIGDAPAAAP
jgi:hypothetical protein